MCTFQKDARVDELSHKCAEGSVGRCILSGNAWLMGRHAMGICIMSCHAKLKMGTCQGAAKEHRVSLHSMPASSVRMLRMLLLIA